MLSRLAATAFAVLALSGCAPRPPLHFGGDVLRSEGELVHAFLREARHQEERGDLVQAVRQLELALTVDPHHAEAAGLHARLDRELREQSDRHFAAGMRYFEKRQYPQARKELLKALWLRPDHPGRKQALEALRQR